MICPFDRAPPARGRDGAKLPMDGEKKRGRTKEGGRGRGRRDGGSQINLVVVCRRAGSHLSQCATLGFHYNIVALSGPSPWKTLTRTVSSLFRCPMKKGANLSKKHVEEMCCTGNWVHSPAFCFPLRGPTRLLANLLARKLAAATAECSASRARRAARLERSKVAGAKSSRDHLRRAEGFGRSRMT